MSNIAQNRLLTAAERYDHAYHNEVKAAHAALFTIQGPCPGDCPDMYQRADQSWGCPVHLQARLMDSQVMDGIEQACVAWIDAAQELLRAQRAYKVAKKDNR